jgi:predicted nucleic acid-binding protein
VSRFVVDASIAVKWLLPEAHTDAARRTLSGDHELLAPDLIWAEVGSAIWKRWRSGQIGSDTARILLSAFRRAPLQISESKVLMDSAWDIAERYDRSFYDSLYLALAVIAECPLVTADLKLYNRLKASPFADRLVWVENTP